MSRGASIDVVANPRHPEISSSEGQLREYAVRMKALGEKIEEHEAILKNLKADYDALRLRKIPEFMESLGIPNITFAGLGRLQLAADLHCSTREGQKDQAMQWLRDCGYEGMITEGYNPSSLKAVVKRLLIEGAEVPTDIFNVSPFTRASLVKV